MSLINMLCTSLNILVRGGRKKCEGGEPISLHLVVIPLNIWVSVSADHIWASLFVIVMYNCRVSAP